MEEIADKIIRWMHRILAVIGAAVILLTIFFYFTNAANMETLITSLALIKSYSLYQKDVSSGDFIMGATEGIVAALDDPYSYYMSPEEWTAQQETLNAEFYGIGVYMSLLKDGSVVLMAPIPNTPAEKAGLQSGDILLSVDGKSLENMSLDEVSALVRGEEGTEVRLSVQREEDGEYRFLEFTVKRAKVEVPSTFGAIIDEEAGIGYIELTTFHSKSPEEISEQIEKLEKQGAVGLVLDLRDNGGGDYNAALKIADYFLDDKDLVQIADANEVLYTEHSNPGSNEIPLVLLVNENTASSSEVLASSLRDNQRAKIVGTTTFGKGIIQVLFPLDDGGALKLTTNQYLNLQGKKIHQIGLVPDQEIEAEENENGEEEDVQLDAAVKLLKKQLASAR